MTEFEQVAEGPVTIPVYQIQLVREGEQCLIGRPVVVQPQDAVHVFTNYLSGKDRECFAVLMLDTRSRYIGLNTVSVGTIDSALVNPREVFKAAILTNAASILVCHNHPSGDPEPSPQDRMVTHRLMEAGKVLGIEVLDHLVIGERGSYRSLKQLGMI
jgi:DNA repair protein RadC